VFLSCHCPSFLCCERSVKAVGGVPTRRVSVGGGVEHCVGLMRCRARSYRKLLRIRDSQFFEFNSTLPHFA
jgi:hypothetical protein